ncbi:MAG: hypothetical protein ACXVEE_06070 [Polyangiales bacterium]
MRRLLLVVVSMLAACQDMPSRHKTNAPVSSATPPAVSTPPGATAIAPAPSSSIALAPEKPAELTLEVAPKKRHDILRIEPRKHVLSSTEALMPMKKTFVGKRLVFLNRKGGTYTHGPDDSLKNSTTIFDKTTTIPAYEKGDAAWSTVVACTKAQLARWNLDITDDDPGTKPHIEMVVGGHPSLGGLDDGVGGIAPMLDDCGVNDGAIGFIFSKIFAKNEQEVECEVVSHELGHILGLDHEYHCPDNMTYLDGCGAKHFVDQAVPCGESKARACTCGPTQNSVAVIDKNIGLATTPPILTPPVTPPPVTPPPVTPPPVTPPPVTPPPTKKGDGKGPTITPLAPTSGTKLPNGADVTLIARIEDADGIGKAFLRWRVGDNVSEIDCAAPTQGVQCSNFAGTYVFRLPAGKGNRSWSIRAVDAAGNESTSPERTLVLEGEGTTPPIALPPGIKLPPIGTATPPPVSNLEATFSAPDDAQTFHFGDTIAVRVTVKGPADSVQVVWRGTFGDEIQPLTKGAGGVWSGNLVVPKLAFPGPRRLRATAKSATGASVEAKARTITILP